MWKSACLTPAQALPGFVALSHENPKIALSQTAKCGILGIITDISHIPQQVLTRFANFCSAEAQTQEGWLQARIAGGAAGS
jgi:hypothetical protein